jgi:hypothetical protein
MYYHELYRNASYQKVKRRDPSHPSIPTNNSAGHRWHLRCGQRHQNWAKLGNPGGHTRKCGFA